MDTANWGFVIGAYIITWLVIIGYLLHVNRALRDARERGKGIAGMLSEVEQ